METILDHSPTDQELQSLFGRSDTALKASLAGSETADSAFANIAALMGLRGDDSAKQSYLEKIQDPQLRFDANLSTLNLS